MIGRTVGHYRIVAKLGTGGMGEVYRAEDLRLNRDIALKVLAPALASRHDYIRRFHQEARCAASLNHPQIVTIHSVEEVDGLPFLTMELVEGVSLKEMIPAQGLPLTRCLDIAIALCTGLAAAHAQGLIHRDLKPENVVVTPEGRVKILDFGIAKALADDDETRVESIPVETTPDESAEKARISERLTEPGRVLGTAAYMSPEQVRGRPVDPRSDLFSLGVLLYEMMTGNLPFHGETPNERMLAILRDPPLPPSTRRHDLPGRLNEIVLRCLEKQPQDRYASASELMADLRALCPETGDPRAFSSQSRSATLSSGAPPRRWTRPIWTATAVLPAVIAVSTLLPGNLVQPPPGGASPVVRARPSVAVLPLDDLSGTPEYFVDGMTDALISSLGKVRGIRVISRQSVMRYKDSNKPLPEIADELGVEMILDGAVLRSRDRIRLTAQLFQAAPEEQIWSASYERPVRDVLDLQGELSQDIARKIEIELSEQERKSLSPSRPLNPGAFEAYLQGRHFWNRRTYDGYQLAIEQFEKATRLDPAFAQAYTGLADAYCVLGFHYTASDQAFTRAEAAARKALELDPLLAEAHTSLAGALLFYRWDWEGAEKEFRRALELNPSYSTAHTWYWALLAARGRHEESAERIRLALELDPHSLVIQNSRGLDLLFADRPLEAFQEFDRIVALDPGFTPVYFNRWLANAALGREAAAMADHVKTLRVLGFSDAADVAERTDRQAGYRAAFAASAEKLIEMSRQKFFSPYHIAYLFELAGDKARALEWMERSHAERAPGLLWIKVSPLHRAIAQEPRYLDLLQRMGFSPASPAQPPGKTQNATPPPVSGPRATSSKGTLHAVPSGASGDGGA